MRVESEEKNEGFASQPQLQPCWEQGQVVLWGRCTLPGIFPGDPSRRPIVPEHNEEVWGSVKDSNVLIAIMAVWPAKIALMAK